MGFRGEALASIAAVSRVELLTCAAGETGGTRYILEGGVDGQLEDAGCPQGTTIVVRDLFYNVPARMKFLKKDSAEGMAVSNGIVQHLALRHPGSPSSYIREGTELKLHHPRATEHLLSAIHAVMGRNFASYLMPIREAAAISPGEDLSPSPEWPGHPWPSAASSSTAGSSIANLCRGLEEAYHNSTLMGKFPGCVLRLIMPADRLDVNVHPAKTVVKFVNDKEAFNAVYYTVLDALNTPAPQPKSPNRSPFTRP